jgi:hypothetical protein
MDDSTLGNFGSRVRESGFDPDPYRDFFCVNILFIDQDFWLSPSWFQQWPYKENSSVLLLMILSLFPPPLAIYGNGNIQFSKRDGHDVSLLGTDGSGAAGYIRLHPLSTKPFSQSRSCHTKLLVIIGNATLLLEKREEALTVGNYLTVEKGELTNR